MYAKRYSNDPRWITAKFTSQCSHCTKEILKGKPAYYFPASRSCHCEECGKESALKFAAQAWDEENNMCM